MLDDKKDNSGFAGDLPDYGKSLEIGGVSNNDVNAFIREAAGKNVDANGRGVVGDTKVASAELGKTSPVKPISIAEPVLAVKNKLISKIEAILEEGLDTVCFGMSAEKQVVFSGRGEGLANEIMDILTKGADKKAKIGIAIKSWLNLIDGINIYFLEQEVKIKTDEIIRLL